MSHRHFCDFASHTWECAGTALRPLAGDTESSVCMCLVHQVTLADGDHGECPVELLACPEHRDQQLRDMYTLATNDLLGSEVDGESTTFKDGDGHPVVGFCLWCNLDFHSMAEAEAHHADDSRACAAFQDWKDRGALCSLP